MIIILFIYIIYRNYIIKHNYIIKRKYNAQLYYMFMLHCIYLYYTLHLCYIFIYIVCLYYISIYIVYLYRIIYLYNVVAWKGGLIVFPWLHHSKLLLTKISGCWSKPVLFTIPNNAICDVLVSCTPKTWVTKPLKLHLTCAAKNNVHFILHTKQCTLYTTQIQPTLDVLYITLPECDSPPKTELKRNNEWMR